MAIIMKGTEIANKMKQELSDWVKDQNFTDQYVAIIYVGDNPASATYVHMKQKFAHEVDIGKHC